MRGAGTRALATSSCSFLSRTRSAARRTLALMSWCLGSTKRPLRVSEALLLLLLVRRRWNLLMALLILGRPKPTELSGIMVMFVCGMPFLLTRHEFVKPRELR